jgi:hypothetical protein
LRVISVKLSSILFHLTLDQKSNELEYQYTPA